MVELLLTTIRPWQLMVGKVAGIGAVGLVQLGVVAAAGVVAGIATHAVSLPGLDRRQRRRLGGGLVPAGILAYALMFAGLGALVSRQEDVAGVTAPRLMVIILPYVLGISILPSDPENQVSWPSAR